MKRIVFAAAVGTVLILGATLTWLVWHGIGELK